MKPEQSRKLSHGEYGKYSHHRIIEWYCIGRDL